MAYAVRMLQKPGVRVRCACDIYLSCWSFTKVGPQTVVTAKCGHARLHAWGQPVVHAGVYARLHAGALVLRLEGRKIDSRAECAAWC